MVGGLSWCHLTLSGSGLAEQMPPALSAFNDDLRILLGSPRLSSPSILVWSSNNPTTSTVMADIDFTMLFLTLCHLEICNLDLTFSFSLCCMCHCVTRGLVSMSVFFGSITSSNNSTCCSGGK